MNEKPQRMTPNPTNPTILPEIVAKIPPPNPKNQPQFFSTIQSRIEGRNKKEHPTQPRLSSTSILHGLIAKLFLLCSRTTVAPLPLPLHPTSCQPSSSSASAAAHVLHLYRRTFVDCCFLLLSSVLLSPLCHQP